MEEGEQGEEKEGEGVFCGVVKRLPRYAMHSLLVRSCGLTCIRFTAGTLSSSWILTRQQNMSHTAFRKLGASHCTHRHEQGILTVLRNTSDEYPLYSQTRARNTQCAHRHERGRYSQTRARNIHCSQNTSEKERRIPVELADTSEEYPMYSDTSEE